MKSLILLLTLSLLLAQLVVVSAGKKKWKRDDSPGNSDLPASTCGGDRSSSNNVTLVSGGNTYNYNVKNKTVETVAKSYDSDAEQSDGEESGDDSEDDSNDGKFSTTFDETHPCGSHCTVTGKTDETGTLGSPLLVLGGIGMTTGVPVATFMRYDLETKKFTSLAVAPMSISRHSAVYYNQALWVFGGETISITQSENKKSFNKDYSLSDKMLKWNSQTGQWTEVTTSGTAPSARAGHGAVLYNGKMFVFGGQTTLGQKPTDTKVYIFDLGTLVWTELTTSGTPPSAREGHSVTVVSESMIVYGGRSSSKIYSDLFALNLDSGAWSQYDILSRGSGNKVPQRVGSLLIDCTEPGAAVGTIELCIIGGYGQGRLDNIWRVVAALPETEEPLLNYINVQGTRFATIDDSDFDLHGKKCGTDTSFVEIPAGWSLAENNIVTTAASMFGKWGAHCLLLKDGSVVPSRRSEFYERKSSDFCSGIYLDHVTLSGVDKYKVSACTNKKVAKLFLEQPGNINDTVMTMVNDIQYSITFIGNEYATIDDTNPRTRKMGSQKVPLALPDGWGLATDTTTTRAAVMGSRYLFGTQCLVLADGTAVSSSSAEDCDSSDFGLVSEGGLYLPNTSYARVLITRTARPGKTVDSWSHKYSITSTSHKHRYVKVGGAIYATIENVHPRKSRYKSSCSDVARELPSGWSLAPNDGNSLTAIKKSGFGSKCFIFSDGTALKKNGKVCSTHGGHYDKGYHGGKDRTDPPVNQLLNVGTYYSARSCPARILIKKEALVSQTCTSWGDPHYTTFGGTHYSFYGVGDYLLARSPQNQTDIVSGSGFTVHTRHVRVGKASANSALAVQHGSTVVKLFADSIPSLYVNSTLITEGSYAFDSKGSRTIVMGDLTINQYGGKNAASMNRHRPAKGRRRTPSSSYVIMFSTTPKLELICKVRKSWISSLSVIDITLRYTMPVDGSGVNGLCGSSGQNEFLTTDGTSTGLNQASSVSDFNSWAETNWKVLVSSTLVGSSGYNDTRPIGETPLTDLVFPNENDEHAARKICRDAGIKDDFLTQCMTDILLVGDEDIAESSADTQIFESTSSMGVSNCTIMSVNMSRTVVFADRTYALLDGANPLSSQPGCHTGRPIAVPAGWSLAKNSGVNRAAVASFPFAAACIVLADGNGVTRMAKSCGSGLLERFEQPIVDSTELPGGPVCLGVAKCSARILIVRDAGTGPEIGETLTDTQWTDIDLTEQEINNFGDGYVTGSGGGAGFVINDPLLENAASTWEQYGTNGFSVTQDPDDPTRTVIKCSLSKQDFTTTEAGARQKVLVNQTIPTAFRVCAWSKAEDVSGGVDNDYAVFVDVWYKNSNVKLYGQFGGFTTGTHGWQYKCADVIPTQKIDFMYVHLLFRKHSGIVYFDHVTIEPPSGQAANLVGNGGFNNKDLADPDYWKTYMKGFSYDDSEEALPLGGFSIKAISPNEFDDSAAVADVPFKQSRGAYQINLLNETSAPTSKRGLYVGGWSKALEMSGSVDPFYSIYIDIFYKDGTYLYGQTVPFQTGTHDWEFEDTVIVLENKAILAVQTVCLLRGHKGTAWFDEISVYFVNAPSESRPAVSHGDPHLISLDGYAFDLQSIGEFLLTSDPDLTVQTRHAPAGDASVNSAVAVDCCKLSGGGRHDTVVIERANGTDSPHIFVNGMVVDLGDSRSFVLPNTNGELSETGILVPYPNASSLRYEIEFPTTGHQVDVEVRVSSYGVQYLRTIARYPDTSKGLTRGLLGNFDGDKTNDIVTSDGVQYDTNSVDFNTLVHVFGESWQIKYESESLFVYQAGSGPETFADSSVNAYPLTTNNFTTTQVNWAGIQCQKSDIGVGTNVYTACVIDVLATGDSSYAIGMASTAASLGELSAPLIPLPETSTPFLGIPEPFWTAIRIVGGILVAVVIVVVIWKVRKKRISKQEREKMKAATQDAIRDEDADPEKGGEDLHMVEIGVDGEHDDQGLLENVNVKDNFHKLPPASSMGKV